MKIYNRIIAAVDFSNYAKLVAEHAATLAHELEAELVLVHVINDRDIDNTRETVARLQDNKSRINIQKCIDQLFEDRKRDLEALKQSIDSGKQQVRGIVRNGVPFRELLTAISEEKADMMVTGIKGRSNLVDVMVGSQALKMFKRCPVTLVTVRQSDEKVTD